MGVSLFIYILPNHLLLYSPSFRESTSAMRCIPRIDRGASCNSVCCHLMGSFKVNFMECTCCIPRSVYYSYQCRHLLLHSILLMLLPLLLLQLLQLPAPHLILLLFLPVLRNIFLWPCPFINLLLLGLVDHYSLQDVLTALYVSYLTTPYSVLGEFT